MTLSIGLAPEIEPVTSRFTVKRSTNWANSAAVFFAISGWQKDQLAGPVFLSFLFL